MGFARKALSAMVFMASFGLASAQTAAVRHVRVVSPSHLEITSSGHFVGKVSLAVGTQLDVDGVDGEFLLVHIHQVHGRVPAKDTDVNGPQAPAQAEPAPQAGAPAAVQAPAQPQAARTTAAAPTSAPPPKVVIYTQDERAAGGIGSSVAAIVFCGAMLLATVILVAGYWRLFTKAGQPGWAILVPIYNMIVMQQVAGKPLWWIVLYFIPVVNIVIAVLCVFAVAENFGKGRAYGLGMLFFPWVFVPMLAFSDARFAGGARRTPPAAPASELNVPS
jgi:hypothetical protein